MSLAELLRIASRYTLAFGRGHLSVFMAGVSISGLILATALLLTVLSVMNGFEREMRDRILALVPHISVHTPADGEGAHALGARLSALRGVRGASRYVSFDAIAVRGAAVTALRGLGVERLERDIPGFQALPALDTLQGVLLGDALARRLGARAGDAIHIVVSPPGAYRQAAIASHRVSVAAVLDTGTEMDEALALMPLSLASRLAGLEGGISGWHLRIEDPFREDLVLPELRRVLPPGSYATSWRSTHGNLYAAIQLSRDLVVLLLASVIGVAAFNVVSALVLIVIDQRAAIAILRTLGATPGAMATLFLLQGLLIGLLGSVLGCALGILLSRSLPALVARLEAALGRPFLNTDVYPISFIPVDLRAADALLIGAVAVGMCLLAALYPALRAARVQPARVLHQEL